MDWLSIWESEFQGGKYEGAETEVSIPVRGTTVSWILMKTLRLKWRSEMGSLRIGVARIGLHMRARSDSG